MIDLSSNWVSVPMAVLGFSAVMFMVGFLIFWLTDFAHQTRRASDITGESKDD